MQFRELCFRFHEQLIMNPQQGVPQARIHTLSQATRSWHPCFRKKLITVPLECKTRHTLLVNMFIYLHSRVDSK